jgi:hypothetical protein
MTSSCRHGTHRTAAFAWLIAAAACAIFDNRSIDVHPIIPIMINEPILRMTAFMPVLVGHPICSQSYP